MLCLFLLLCSIVDVYFVLLFDCVDRVLLFCCVLFYLFFLWCCCAIVFCVCIVCVADCASVIVEFLCRALRCFRLLVCYVLMRGVFFEFVAFAKLFVAA